MMMNQTKIIKTSRKEKVCIDEDHIKGTSFYHLSKHIFYTRKLFVGLIISET